MRLPWCEVSLNGGVPVPTSLTPGEAQRLAWLARDAHVLEIGTAYGYSAVVMALGARHVLTVDPFEAAAGDWGGFGAPTPETVLRTIEGYKATQTVASRIGRSDVVMCALVEAQVAFDLIFLDGDHSADAFSLDLDLAQKLLTPGGILACHDYDEDSCPDVRTVLDQRFAKPDELVDTLWVRART